MSGWTDGTTNTRSLLMDHIAEVYAMLDAYADGTLSEYAKEQEWETDDYALDDDDYQFTVVDYLSDALDVNIYKNTNGMGDTLVDVLLTVGGPTIRLQRDFGGSHIVGYWGGERVSEYHHALDAFLDEVVEIVGE